MTKFNLNNKTTYIIFFTFFSPQEISMVLKHNRQLFIVEVYNMQFNLIGINKKKLKKEYKIKESVIFYLSWLVRASSLSWQLRMR